MLRDHQTRWALKATRGRPTGVATSIRRAPERGRAPQSLSNHRRHRADHRSGQGRYVRLHACRTARRCCRSENAAASNRRPVYKSVEFDRRGAKIVEFDRNEGRNDRAETHDGGDIYVLVRPGLCQHPSSPGRMIGIVPVNRGDARTIRQLRIDVLQADPEARSSASKTSELIELFAKCANRLPPVPR